MTHIYLVKDGISFSGTPSARYLHAALSTRHLLIPLQPSFHAASLFFLHSLSRFQSTGILKFGLKTILVTKWTMNSSYPRRKVLSPSPQYCHFNLALLHQITIHLMASPPKTVTKASGTTTSEACEWPMT